MCRKLGLLVAAVVLAIILAVADLTSTDTTDSDNSSGFATILKSKLIDFAAAAASKKKEERSRYRYYIYPAPRLTTNLVRNSTGQICDEAERYVETAALDEDLAEIWLHRGFERLRHRTANPLEADVYMIPAYVYMSWRGQQRGAGVDMSGGSHSERVESFKSDLGRSMEEVAWAFGLFHPSARTRGGLDADADADSTDYDPNVQVENDPMYSYPDRPHVLLCPATNANEATAAGIPDLVNFLSSKVGRSNVYVVSFERNRYWAGGALLRNIIVAPYVVRPHLSLSELRSLYVDDSSPSGSGNSNSTSTSRSRINGFVFYVANPRPNAITWAGCNRSMVLPLQDEPNTKIGLGVRINHHDFQRYMTQSDYCLVTCGDTPTSRRLTDSMLMGCIPIFIGNRLFGRCDPPCHAGYGWTYTRGLSHLPYEDEIPWKAFPTVDEGQFAASPKTVLDGVIRNITATRKRKLRAIMQRSQLAWVYGWGSPVSSNQFGMATNHLWRSMCDVMSSRNQLADDLLLRR